MSKAKPVKRAKKLPGTRAFARYLDGELNEWSVMPIKCALAKSDRYGIRRAVYIVTESELRALVEAAEGRNKQ